MDLDDIDRWRAGGSNRDHYRSRYAPQYCRKWNDAYQSTYDPPPPRRYFNDDPPSPKLPPRRSAPPPPPPPPPPHRSESQNAKRKHKHHSKPRRKRRARSASFTSSDATSTVTSRTSSTSSADSTTSSTTTSSSSSSSSGSYEPSDSERGSATTSSTSSTSASSKSTCGNSSTSSHERRAQPHKMQKHLQRHANALSRVAAKPIIAAQDEEIAAAAACRAILSKEAQLKEQELRLLQQKRNFAAEVQRRSSQPHRFVAEDDAIRQMQRLVDLTDTTPALEEFLRRTSKAPPASGASTDAGALTYLRSCEGTLSRNGVAPLLSRIVAPPPTPATTAAANVRCEERLVIVGDEPPVPTSQPSGSPEMAPSATTPFIAASAPTASERVELRGTSAEVDSLLEHSLPVEGHLLTRSPPPTPTDRARAPAPSERVPAQSLTVDAGKTENQVFAAGAPAEGAVTAANGEQKQGGSVAPAKEKAAEAAEPAASRPLKGGRVTCNELVQRRRIKVKVRRRRSRSHVPAHQSETDDDAALEGDPSPNEKRQDRVVSPPAGNSQPAQRQQSIGAPLQLLPPPPSPASHVVAERQLIFSDPVQQYSQGGTKKQPWAVANWPCNAPPRRSTQKGKDGPPALWYASNSPVPLSHREFKSLLCSEYVSPEMTTVLAPGAADATIAGVDADKQLSAAPTGTKAGRDAYVPYGGGAAHVATPSRATGAGERGAQRNSRHRSVRIQDVNEDSGLPFDVESAHREGDSPARIPAKLSALPPVALRGDEDELVVEFPPPPHMMASDMPPPGDVGSDGEDSCCGCGGSGCSCCSAPCAGFCSCWSAMFSCLFPCCCGRKAKVAQSTEPQRRLAFQRPDPASAPPILPLQMQTTPATTNVQP
ncbi:hypothetical protein LdCL_110006400 [Leishmania donovani]|uniref:Uncharacterized protein n=1 Tax=Leishmania donovani TaxID=5661 RepID=A0A3Q8I8W5_LEIDO|nr:hypothetical protein LdCL_110006400 [Leishmania donovani]